MKLKYKWIINAGEIHVGDAETNTLKPDEPTKEYQSFIDHSFNRGCIDANELSRLLFPNCAQPGKKQIFISHPHNCSDAARHIKNLLSKQYYCFVDVDVWEQVDSILTALQCKSKSTGSLILNQCNKWAAHMYLMLSQAILREIAKSHIILYIESGNEDSEIIQSPWLYYELSAVQSLASSNRDLLKEANFSAMSMPVIKYNIKNLTSDFLRIDACRLAKLPTSSPEELDSEVRLLSCFNRWR